MEENHPLSVFDVDESAALDLRDYFAAVVEPRKFKIVLLLMLHRRMTSGDIARATQSSISATAHRLSALRFADVVDFEQVGKTREYFIKPYAN